MPPHHLMSFHRHSMYDKLTKEQVIKKCDEHLPGNTCRDFSLNNVNFICSTQGLLFRKMKTGYWKEIQNTKNHAKGYNVILVDKKQYSRAKLILFACNKINLSDKNRNIYHKNMNRLDCSIDNLTLDVPNKKTLSRKS